LSVNIRSEIMKIILTQSKKYPVTIKDIENISGYTNSLISKKIKILQSEGLIESKRVIKPKGGVNYYKTPEIKWPINLGEKCSDCQNRSTIGICTFHEELADNDIIIEPERIGIQLTGNTYACKYFIKKKTYWKKKRLEDFLDESRRLTQTKNGFDIGYHCLNPNCGAKLPPIGYGFIAKLGSSVLRCNDCNSFYKIIFDNKKEAFIVHYNMEDGLTYKKNLNSIIKSKDPEPLYSSEKFGIVIPDLRFANFNFRSSILTVGNWVGKLTEIKYIVAKKVDDYKQLLELLSTKGYGDIDIILGTEKIISPPPIKQQVGILQLLREIMIVNKEFCISMLESRITIIKKVHSLFNGKRETLVKKAILEISNIIKEIESKTWLSPRDWNIFEMRGGKEMWKVIATYLEDLEIFFPGRGKSRLVRDPSTPHRLYYAYSAIDTLINGVYSKGGDFVKEYCSEIGFCWDGLPGLCHGKTTGGIFGLHLDLREQEKVLILPFLIEAIVDERINSTDVLYLRGRNREKIYYVLPNTEIYEQIELVTEEALKSKLNGFTSRNVIKQYYLQGKQWLRNLQLVSNNFEIRHHGIEYQPWALIKERIWVMLGEEEKVGLIEFLQKEHERIGFEPITLREIN